MVVVLYGVKSLAEVGVCTGMSVVNVLEQHAAWSGGLAPLERYYMVDPWGERRCDPGCGCSKPLRRLAKAFAPVLVPVQGYSAKMAPSIPNASLDLAFIDAAHDYRNVRADVLAYWPKLKPDGVLAGQLADRVHPLGLQQRRLAALLICRIEGQDEDPERAPVKGHVRNDCRAHVGERAVGAGFGHKPQFRWGQGDPSACSA